MEKTWIVCESGTQVKWFCLPLHQLELLPETAPKFDKALVMQ